MAHTAAAYDPDSMATYPFVLLLKLYWQSRLYSHLVASMHLILLCLHLFGVLSVSLGCNMQVVEHWQSVFTSMNADWCSSPRLKGTFSLDSSLISSTSSDNFT